MPRRFLWKIGGEAGHGIMTSGLIFSKVASRSGYHIFDYVEYPSLVRGGHNTYEVLVSDEAVYASKKEIDLLICLNEDTYKFHEARLTDNSLVVYDKEEFKIERSRAKLIEAPFKEILKSEKASSVMLNNVALGVSFALMGWDFKSFEVMIRDIFSKKGEEVIKVNLKVSKAGYEHIQKNYKDNIQKEFKVRKGEKKLVITGNDAFALGAIVADCRLYCAYPMTPSSSTLHTLASYATKTGMVVRHSEDEIAIINTAIGASVAGVRSAFGTSGGGFALMVESVSLAGVTETPLVMFLVQRPGPATGMPTWTEQGDLLFYINAGHGEFPKIVLAPGDIKEMYELTAKAFDLADIYQTPVVVLSDKLLAESHKSTSAKDFLDFSKNYKPDQGKTINEVSEEKYLRYKLIADGVSPRLIPGFKGQYFQANSYEHSEDGHTSEDSENRKAQVDKRAQKTETYLEKDWAEPEFLGSKDSETVFVSWGSNKGAILEAMKELDKKGVKTSFIHFTHVFPLLEKKLKKIFSKNKRFILVENNSHAQFGKLLRQETGIEIKEKLLKYDGRPIYVEDIINFVNK